MSDKLIPDGTYTVRGPGGLLTMSRDFPGVAVLPPQARPQDQQWTVACDADAYTLLSESVGLYLGSDVDPNEPQMVVKGTEAPFGWKLSEGVDDDEKTHILTSAASSDGLRLGMSLLRIFPPLVAILPPNDFRDVEWAFDPV